MNRYDIALKKPPPEPKKEPEEEENPVKILNPWDLEEDSKGSGNPIFRARQGESYRITFMPNPITYSSIFSYRSPLPTLQNINKTVIQKKVHYCNEHGWIVCNSEGTHEAPCCRASSKYIQRYGKNYILRYCGVIVISFPQQFHNEEDAAKYLRFWIFSERIFTLLKRTFHHSEILGRNNNLFSNYDFILHCENEDYQTLRLVKKETSYLKQYYPLNVETSLGANTYAMHHRKEKLLGKKYTDEELSNLLGVE